MVKTRIECVVCHQVRANAGRNLCDSCHDKVDLALYPKKVKNRDMVLDAWAKLTPIGYTQEEVAKHLGMTRISLKRALNRARRDNDPRAVYRRDVWEG